MSVRFLSGGYQAPLWGQPPQATTSGGGHDFLEVWQIHPPYTGGQNSLSEIDAKCLELST